MTCVGNGQSSSYLYQVLKTFLYQVLKFKLALPTKWAAISSPPVFRASSPDFVQGEVFSGREHLALYEVLKARCSPKLSSPETGRLQDLVQKSFQDLVQI